MRKLRVSALLLLFPLSVAAVATAAVEAREPLYAQVLIGDLHLHDNTVTLTRQGEDYDGKLERLPYVGAAAQVIWRDDWIGYGWEGGGFVSWINDQVDYYARSDSNGLLVKISVDNVFWSVDTFMGLYVSARPLPGLRLYLSGGPLAIYAVARTESPETDTTTTSSSSTSAVTNGGSTIIIDVSNKDTDFNIGAYARAGVELHLADNLWAGISARYMKTDLNLEDSLGRFAIDGTLIQFSLTHRL